jgi:hypothetical protein
MVAASITAAHVVPARAPSLTFAMMSSLQLPRDHGISCNAGAVHRRAIGDSGSVIVD